MNKEIIYILTGAIQTGKTTALIQWSKNRNDIFGILTPIVNGKRCFMDAHSKDQFEMEARKDETETIAIGRFIFSKTTFEKAGRIISNAKDKKGWLVIDEIGPLELREEGFYKVLNEVLKNHVAQLLLVVREGLVGKTKKLFKLNEVHIVTKEEVEKL